MIGGRSDSGKARCARLSRQLEKDSVRHMLTDGVDKSLGPVREFRDPGTVIAARGVPATIGSESQLTGGKIGLPPSSQDNQIRLVVDEHDKMIAGFFGEGRRYGYLVALNANHSLFGINSGKIMRSIDRVAVYCDGDATPGSVRWNLNRLAGGFFESGRGPPMAGPRRALPASSAPGAPHASPNRSSFAGLSSWARTAARHDLACAPGRRLR